LDQLILRRFFIMTQDQTERENVTDIPENNYTKAFALAKTLVPVPRSFDEFVKALRAIASDELVTWIDSVAQSDEGKLLKKIHAMVRPENKFDDARDIVEQGPPENAVTRLCACVNMGLDETSIARLITIASKLAKVPKKAVEKDWKTAKEQYEESQRRSPGEVPNAPSGTRMEYQGFPKILVTLDELNERFAMYEGEGTVAYVEKAHSWILPKGTLLDKLESQIVFAYQSPAGPVFKPAGKTFLGNADKTVYNRIVFKNEDVAPNELNLFHGFGVDPKAGDCELILSHIREVICSGEELRYERFLDLLAWQIQNVGKVSRIIVVLFTRKHQAGKGIILEMMTEIYGTAGAQISEKKHILGQFNSALQGKAFIFFDESIFGGSVVDANKLKTLATAKMTTVEGKFVNPVSCPIAVNIYMASNSERAAHVEEDDARYWILNCSEHRIGDTVYFEALDAQIKNGGKEAFMHFLMERDVSAFIPQRDVPRDNAEKSDMIRECRNALDIRNWIEDCCRTETIIGKKITLLDKELKTDVDWVPGMDLTFAEILSAYRNWQSQVKNPVRGEPTGTKKLAQTLKEAGIIKRRERPSRKEFYCFPTISTCLSNLGFDTDPDDDPEPTDPKPEWEMKRKDGNPFNQKMKGADEEAEGPQHGSSWNHPAEIRQRFEKRVFKEVRELDEKLTEYIRQAGHILYRPKENRTGSYSLQAEFLTKQAGEDLKLLCRAYCPEDGGKISFWFPDERWAHLNSIWKDEAIPEDFNFGTPGPETQSGAGAAGIFGYTVAQPPNNPSMH
jgi:hypothetical protein